MKAGDTIPLRGVRVDVVASSGRVIDKPINSGGALNPYCRDAERKDPNTGCSPI